MEHQSVQADIPRSPERCPLVPISEQSGHRKDPRFDPHSYWRGDVWPAPNYQVACGFARHGYREIAADIADKTIANALNQGISEHYDSITGKPLGVPYLGMTCTVLTLMLDRLSSRYKLKLKGAR